MTTFKNPRQCKCGATFEASKTDSTVNCPSCRQSARDRDSRPAAESTQATCNRYAARFYAVGFEHGSTGQEYSTDRRCEPGQGFGDDYKRGYDAGREKFEAQS